MGFNAATGEVTVRDRPDRVVEISFDGSRDGRLEQELIDHMADYIAARTKGRWAIALDGETTVWDVMYDDARGRDC